MFFLAFAGSPIPHFLRFFLCAQDINTNKSILDALRAETAFFASHPEYSRYSARMGTPFLSKTLNKASFCLICF
jgi:hypothetical protein